MKATTSTFVLAAALLSAACGEGRAIINVDVYSFIQGTGKDSIPYLVPPGTGNFSKFQTINLPPGFGSSVVESATITGNANLINSGGTGSIGFQLYVAKDSAGTLLPGALAVNVDSTAVSGTNVSSLAISGGLTPAVLSVLNEPQMWIRLVAKGTNPNLTPVTGVMALTALQLQVIIQEKIL